jgi:hypothetical protein
MSQTRHVDVNADGPAQIGRTLVLKNRLVGLALADSDDGVLAAAVEEYYGNPVVLGSVACLLAQELARVTEKAARVAAYYATVESLARVQAIGDMVPLAFKKAD